jgi:small subunit ribosomal protein S20
MPNKHAAIKDLRKSKKRTVANRRMKTHVKSLIHQFENLLKEGKKTEAAALAPKLQQALDKAGKGNVIHPNKASRKLSSVHRALVKAK